MVVRITITILRAIDTEPINVYLFVTTKACVSYLINIFNHLCKIPELSKAIESLKNAKEESNKILAEARDKVNDLMAPLEQDVQEKQRALRYLQISYNKKYANSSPKYYVSVVRTVRPMF